MSRTILHIDASARETDSMSRELSAKLVAHLSSQQSEVELVVRDLVKTPIPLITEAMIGAYYTDPAERSAEQNQVIAVSDQLVAELKAADIIVIGTPMYNFNIPASLKAWIDQIARAGETFKYTENGPVGLLENKKAYVVVSTGGVPVGSGYDFLTPFVRHVLGFVGITDVEFIAADQVMSKAEEARASALEKIEAIAA